VHYLHTKLEKSKPENDLKTKLENQKSTLKVFLEALPKVKPDLLPLRLGIAVHARREQSKHVRRRLLTTKRLAEVFDFFFVKVCGTQFCFSQKTARKRLSKILLLRTTCLCCT